MPPPPLMFVLTFAHNLIVVAIKRCNLIRRASHVAAAVVGSWFNTISEKLRRNLLQHHRRHRHSNHGSTLGRRARG